MKHTRRIVTSIIFFLVVTMLATTAFASTKTVKVTLQKKAKTISKTVSVGDTIKISVNKVASSKPTYKSSKKSIATVSKKGVITAKKVGSTTITVKYKKKTTKLKITVVRPVTKVAVNPTSYTFDFSKSSATTKQIKATVSPSNATNKKITWASDTTAVATVNTSGVVTAKKNGTAFVSAKSNNGIVAFCKITVKNKGGSSGGNSGDNQQIIPTTVAVTSVTLSKTSATINKGTSLQLSAQVKPSNATNKTVTWSSSNTSVATVSTAGLVTAKGKGSATITATADGKKATCTITVNVPVTSITLSQTSANVEKDKTLQLTATVNPSDATNKTVTWSSSNTSIATVSSSGLVTAKACSYSTATITASAGGKTASCIVTVPFTKTIGGVTFEFSGVNNQSMTIYANKAINESDTKWLINNGNFVQGGDNADFIKYTDEYTERFYGYIPTVKQGVCVEYGSVGGNTTQYNFVVTNANRALNFPVAFYYKNTLVVQTTINAPKWTGNGYAIAKNAEQYALNNGLNPDNNFKAFLAKCAVYLEENYTYGQMTCTYGAQILKQVCHDYGYMTRILFPYAANYNKAPYYSENCVLINSHTVLGVKINGQWEDCFAAQGRKQ